MCVKCEPVISCDFTCESTIDCLNSLVREAYKIRPASRWTRCLWNNNQRVWGGKLGETLRRELCVPDLSGEELRQAYANSCYSVLNINLDQFAPAVTAEDCTNQKVKSARGKKLTRYLAERLTKQWQGEALEDTPLYIKNCWGGWKAFHSYQQRCEYSPDNVSKLVDRIQADVRSRNGMRLVLSANPLDKLTCSEFATYQSCHRFGGEYQSGAYQYAAAPNVLILYAYRSLCSKYGLTLPQKCFRQVAFLPDDCSNSAILSRVYGGQLNGLNSELSRRMVAELLADQDNPPWRKVDIFDHELSTYGYAYDSDELTCLVTIEPKPDKDDGCPSFYTSLSAPLCPRCGCERSDGRSGLAMCDNCHQCNRCRNCGDIVDDDDSAIGPGGRTLCQCCYEANCFYCDGCEEDQWQTSSVDTVDGLRCRGCVSASYSHCTLCDRYVLDEDMADSRHSHCNDCHKTFLENEPVNAGEEQRELELIVGEWYLTRSGDRIQILEELTNNNDWDYATSLGYHVTSEGRYYAKNSHSISQRDIVAFAPAADNSPAASPLF